MRFFQEQCHGVYAMASSAASLILSAARAPTSEKISGVTRVLVTVVAMACVAVREAGWNAIFMSEMACRLLQFNHKNYHEPSAFFLRSLFLITDLFQALSTFLFVIAQIPNFWSGTKITNWREHFNYKRSEDPASQAPVKPLSSLRKILFVFLGLCGFGNFAINILRNQIGSAAQFEKQWSVPSDLAKILSVVITVFLGLVSLLVKLPGYFRNCYNFSATCSVDFKAMRSRTQNTRSIVNLIMLAIVGGSTAISMVDYLSRFIEAQHEPVDDYIPALICGFIAAGAFSVFTSGASMIKEGLVDKMRKHWFVTTLFLINSVPWLLVNIHQLAARTEQWIFHPHNTTQAHSDSFDDLCRAQFANRHGTLGERVAIFMLSALLALPLTLSMMLYLFDLLLGVKKEAQVSSVSEASSLLWSSVPSVSLNNDGTKRAVCSVGSSY